MANNSHQQYITRFRDRVQASKYEEMLDDHITGKKELTHSQMKAIEILLDRTVPKISAQALVIEDKRQKAPREMSMAEMMEEWDDLKVANG